MKARIINAAATVGVSVVLSCVSFASSPSATTYWTSNYVSSVVATNAATGATISKSQMMDYVAASSLTNMDARIVRSTVTPTGMVYRAGPITLFAPSKR